MERLLTYVGAPDLLLWIGGAMLGFWAARGLLAVRSGWAAGGLAALIACFLFLEGPAAGLALAAAVGWVAGLPLAARGRARDAEANG